jgi:two-component system, OmpR family, sensor kinase
MSGALPRHEAMKSLHGKFFLLIGALVLAMGATAFLLQVRSIREYSLAMTQALNETLAQRIAEAYLNNIRLPLAATPDGASAVRVELAPVMAVNPSIELYVLDSAGKVLAHTAPNEEIRRNVVNLTPIRAFLQHRFMFPLQGDNPRSLEGRAIFSAAALKSATSQDGYLYVILGGPQYDAAARRLQNHLLIRGAFTIVGIGIAVALAGGLFVLITMTRRLRLLVNAMDAFRKSQFRKLASVQVRTLNENDELDRLGHAYNSMVTHIHTQMEKIAQSDALRRDLIAGVSHDLRTPLASLRGYLETLHIKEDTLTPQQRRQYLQIVSSQSERLHRLVEELFELAKLQDLELRINLEPFSLSELVQDIVQKFSLIARDKGLELRAKFMPNAPLMLGDISLIERLLDNLLENAIRHTSVGHIELSITANEEFIALEVSDTGSGIAPEVLPHIFERFYVDKTRGPSSGGSGLGLAIAKRIVELHGGHIMVHSELAVGTRFKINWPARPGLDSWER